MIVAAATVELFARMRMQPLQAAYGYVLDDRTYVAALVECGSWACVADARVLALGGFVDQGGGRAQVWGMLTANIGRQFILVHRTAKRIIDAAPYRRIEMITQDSFTAAHRWAELLGFTPEATLRSWFPVGLDGRLWSKVKQWPQ